MGAPCWPQHSPECGVPPSPQTKPQPLCLPQPPQPALQGATAKPALAPSQRCADAQSSGQPAWPPAQGRLPSAGLCPISGTLPALFSPGSSAPPGLCLALGVVPETQGGEAKARTKPSGVCRETATSAQPQTVEDEQHRSLGGDTAKIAPWGWLATSNVPGPHWCPGAIRLWAGCALGTGKGA